MSKHYALKATSRERAGKGVARALRRENKIPAVIYGDHKEPVTISLDSNAINLEYNKGHMFTSLCDLEVEGSKYSVLARDVQLHPVTDVVLHVDFLRVTAKTKIAVFVPVKFINEDKCPALSNKATLSVVRYEVELLCSAMDIPDHIDVDLAGKQTGDVLHISDAALPKGVTPVISNRNFVIANLNAPRTLDESADAGEAAEGEAEAAAEGEKKAEE